MSDEQTTPIRVRATHTGNYGLALRAPGDVFTITDPTHFSTTWMERVAPETPETIHEMSAPKGGRMTVPTGAPPTRSTAGGDAGT